MNDKMFAELFGGAERLQAVRVTERPGHHAVAMEACAVVLKLPATLIDEADALREWRTRKYEGFFSASERDVADAIEAARKYLDSTRAWVRREPGQLLK